MEFNVILVLLPRLSPMVSVFTFTVANPAVTVSVVKVALVTLFAALVESKPSVSWPRRMVVASTVPAPILKVPLAFETLEPALVVRRF